MITLMLSVGVVDAVVGVGDGVRGWSQSKLSPSRAHRTMVEQTLVMSPSYERRNRCKSREMYSLAHNRW